ncbi:Hypothetical predicted protein [Pelobates cultripes]|uniref:Uncharacterized protein n=1 Tax=Pelobates cultripes TaxID=61616 RepID=A0AAD1WF36_PELCU|nr:Hypothetical predicted protein [Pelobates cultripes]
MTAQHLSGYEIILLNTQNLSIVYSPVNSGPMSVLHAILTSASDSVSLPSEPHNCIEQIHFATSPRADLSSTALSGMDVTTVFVDGYCSRPNDDAILLPSEVAVIHCKAHILGSDDISRGNALADKVAKEVAAKTLYYEMFPAMLTPPTCPTDSLLLQLQAFATQTDFDFWIKQGLEKDQNDLFL